MNLILFYPSLMIALPENEVQRVNAHLSYLDEFRNVMLKTKGGQMQVGIIKGDLQKDISYSKKRRNCTLSHLVYDNYWRSYFIHINLCWMEKV